MSRNLMIAAGAFLISASSFAAATDCTEAVTGQNRSVAPTSRFTCPNPEGARVATYCDGTTGGELMQGNCFDDDLVFTTPRGTPNSIKYHKKNGAFEERVEGQEFKYSWEEANGYDAYIPSNFAWEALYIFSDGGRSLSMTSTMLTREKLYIKSSPFKPGIPFMNSAVLCANQPSQN